MNEWGFAGEIKSWWDAQFRQYVDWRLDRCELENQTEGSLQRSDLECISKPPLWVSGADKHPAQIQKHWPNTVLSLLATLYSIRVLKCALSACRQNRKEVIPPEEYLRFAFPYKRKNKELAKLASQSFNIDSRRYAAHQFPDPVTLPSGQTLSKPPTW